MAVVAGVGPRLQIADRLGGQGRPTLGEHVGGFVRVSQEALRRGVGFGEDDVADRGEACSLPGGEEHIDAVPAVERHAERVRFQDAVNVGEGVEDAGLAIVLDGAAGAVFVPDQVWRVRQHEIHAGMMSCT